MEQRPNLVPPDPCRCSKSKLQPLLRTYDSWVLVMCCSCQQLPFFFFIPTDKLFKTRVWVTIDPRKSLPSILVDTAESGIRSSDLVTIAKPFNKKKTQTVGLRNPIN